MSQPKKRIGLRGPAGAGKSEVARIISEITGWPIARMVGPMKDGLVTMGLSKEHTPHSYRVISQYVGTYMRDQDKRFWVDMFVKRWKDVEGLVCDDVRFEEEAGCFDLLQYIEPGFPAVAAGMTEDAITHDTERWNRVRPFGGHKWVRNEPLNPRACAVEILRRAGYDVPERIYIAGPYSADTREGIIRNVASAARNAARVMERGHEVYCPHTHCDHIDAMLKDSGVDVDYEYWMNMLFSQIRHWATGVYVFANSPGADREEELANELGLKVYRKLSDIPDLRETD